VNGGVYAHSNGFFGSPSGIIVGSQSNHNVSIVTNSRNAITISEIGRVGIGLQILEVISCIAMPGQEECREGLC
jgi:hypothetical protein